MINAEHYALENEAFKQLQSLRQQEVLFFSDRFNTLGTQSALMGGFVISSFTCINPTKVLEGKEEAVTFTSIAYLYWISGALSLACSLHTILNSTFGTYLLPSALCPINCLTSKICFCPFFYSVHMGDRTCAPGTRRECKQSILYFKGRK